MSKDRIFYAPAGRGTIEVKLSADETRGAMSMLLQTMPPGAQTFTHIHINEDEFVYPIVGAPTVTIEGDAATYQPGDVAIVPRGMVHNIANKGTEEIQFLFLLTPGGIEGFFEKSMTNPDKNPAAQAERVLALATEYGMKMIPQE